MEQTQVESPSKGGCPFDLNKWGAENVDEDLLRSNLGGLARGVSLARSTGMHIGYEYQSVYSKALIHYVSRFIIKDLWEFATPRYRDFINEDGRFELAKALIHTDSSELTDDLEENLTIGMEMISKLTGDTYRAWLKGLQQREELGYENDPVPLMWGVYRLHSIMVNGGDSQTNSIMYNTFISAGPELFRWLRDYPDLTRDELETILDDSKKVMAEQASKHTIHSAAREEVVCEVTDRGDLGYILDTSEQKRRIIFNPELEPVVEKKIEEIRSQGFFDRQDIVFMCPAMSVGSELYGSTQNMLLNHNRFRASAFVEIYLETQRNRRERQKR